MTAAHPSVETTMAGVAELLARRSGTTLRDAGLRLIEPVAAQDLERSAKAAGVILVDFGSQPLATAELLGVVFESLQEPDARRRGGVHYTPSAVATRLVDIAVGAWLDGAADGARPTVLDPAIGGGAFLIAAARRLAGPDGLSVVDQLAGRDIDPVAVAVSEAALALLAIELGAPPGTAGSADLSVADALVDPLPTADVIVGNPPFQNQLKASTAHDEARRALLRERFGAAATAYTDSASLFVLASIEALRAGGRAMLIQPLSLLASRDASATRVRILEQAALLGLWFSAEPVFAASVRVCAPLMGDARSPVDLQRWDGPAVEPAAALSLDDPVADDWGYLVADLTGVPAVPLMRSGDRLDSLATATAGFRDQFYGFVPHAREQATPDDTNPQLVTVGMIDPLCQRWGSGSFRFAKQSWSRPVVDIASVEAGDPTLAGWASDRLRPKVVVATQTRVVEAAVDADGRWLPITPGISVEPLDGADIWRIAALLSAPAVSAHLHIAGLGTALSVDAMKMSATALESLPLPIDTGAWTEGAHLAHAATEASEQADPDQWREHLYNLGSVMQRAYGSTTEVYDWWASRLPRWRKSAVPAI